MDRCGMSRSIQSLLCQTTRAYLTTACPTQLFFVFSVSSIVLQKILFFFTFYSSSCLYFESFQLSFLLVPYDTMYIRWVSSHACLLVIKVCRVPCLVGTEVGPALRTSPLSFPGQSLYLIKYPDFYPNVPVFKCPSFKSHFDITRIEAH